MLFVELFKYRFRTHFDILLFNGAIYRNERGFLSGGRL